MKRNKVQLSLLFLTISAALFPQDSIVDTIIFNKGKGVRIVKFIEGKYDIPTSSSLSLIKKYFNTSSEDELIFKSESKDDLGFKHTKYDLYHNGVKVDQAVVIVHQKNNQVVIMNGELPLVRNLDVKPKISSEQALEIALKAVNAKKYAWQENDLEIKFSEAYPNPELVILHNQTDNENSLAFKINIASLEPFDIKTVYIDAKSGEVSKIIEKSKSENAVGTAYTRYSGIVNINTDSYSSGYRLKDITRSQGIFTKNANRTSGTYVTEFSDNDNTWSEHNNDYMDNAALDAHYAAEKTYDYFNTRFGRQSYNNLGSSMQYLVHYGSNWNNAKWYGWPIYKFAFGDGDGARYSPFTACDAIAHEFGHAVTESYGDLTPSGEPGAIDEGLASIWAACVEDYANIPGDQVWFEGERHWLDANHPINFADPNLSHYHEYDNPQNPEHPYTDRYHGTNWYSGSDDYNGVHYNSTIASHWFYLLSQGRADTNEDGINYIVSGIGINAAANIVYHYYDYLTPNSDFSMFSYFTTYVATQLYGSYSNQAIQTWNAWYAVGLWPIELPTPITGNYIICDNSNQTYSLPSEFAGTYIAWTTSENISILSGQGTRTISVSKIASGNGTITATYNLGNGNIVSQKSVWVGSDLPDPLYIEIKGENYEFIEHTNDMWEICPNTIYRLQAHSSSGISQWDWTIPESWQLLSNENSPEILIQTGDYIYWEDEVHVDVYNYVCDTWIYYADYLLVTEPPYGCGESIQYMLYPNPADQTIFIDRINSFDINNKGISLMNKEICNTGIKKGTVVVKIYNDKGVLYENQFPEASFNINISNLPNNLYYIELSTSNRKYKQKVLIWH